MKYHYQVGAIEDNKAKRLMLAAGLAVSAVVMIAGFALAAPFSAITQENNRNPVFEDSGMNSIQNSNNTSVRFGRGGAIVNPGQGGMHANENSVVSEHSTGETILRPGGLVPDVE